ncbi:hypothetical protein JOM56_002798 [Amanita muscaria]
MPNIRRVEWTAGGGDPNWTTSHTVKLLLEFPQLTELSLHACNRRRTGQLGEKGRTFRFGWFEKERLESEGEKEQLSRLEESESFEWCGCFCMPYYEGEGFRSNVHEFLRSESSDTSPPRHRPTWMYNSTSSSELLSIRTVALQVQHTTVGGHQGACESCSAGRYLAGADGNHGILSLCSSLFLEKNIKSGPDTPLRRAHVSLKVNTVSLDTKALEVNGNEELRTLSSSHTEMERSGDISVAERYFEDLQQVVWIVDDESGTRRYTGTGHLPRIHRASLKSIQVQLRRRSHKLEMVAAISTDSVQG